MSLDALPIEVRESALTDSQKKILNVFFTYDTLDYTNENGSFYLTNERLRNEAGIGSKQTVQSVLSFLINNDFIERKAGGRTNNGSVASTYILHSEVVVSWCKDKKIKKIKGTPSKGTPSKGTPSKGTPNNKCTNDKCTNEMLKKLEENALEISLLRKEISELKELIKGTPSKGTPNNKCTTDIDIDKEIDINRSDIYTCNLKDSNEIEIRSSKVSNISDGESTPKENEELKNEDMQQFTAEEVKALNEYYGREWKELQEVRESESMKHKGEYVELSKKINNFNELFRSYYDSKNINTFTERERQLWSLKSQIEEKATHLRLSDKQIDYILSLEVTLQKAMAGKKKFKEKVLKSQTVKVEQQAQPMENVTSNREIISRQQERPCRVQSADGDLSDEINKLFI